MFDAPPSGRHAHALASAADARADARLGQAMGDLFLPDEARLSDRTRAVIHSVLAGIVAALEGEVRRHAARVLAARGAAGEADALLAGAPVFDRLLRSGLLADPELLGELIARVELDLLAEALPAAGASGRPGLLPRLAGSADGVVASSAQALLAAENRRRSERDGTVVRSGLPAEQHHKLVWSVAAAVREQRSEQAGAADRDRALTEAALRNLASHDEGDRPEVAAERLAAAIDAGEDELGALLPEAVADCSLALFTALAARAAGVEGEQVRSLALDPEGDLLALLLHAIGLDRQAIARIGVALADADPRRDLDRLADAIDWAAAHDRAAARAALAPLALTRDFRTAARALARAP